METTENKSYASTGLGTTAVTLGAVALGATALNGGLANLLGGGNRPQPPEPATQRDLSYERQLTECNAKSARLEAELNTIAKIQVVEERLQDKIDALEDKVNAAGAAQAVINERQSGVIGLLQSQVANLNYGYQTLTSPYIRQPIMAASEAALNVFKANPAVQTANTAQTQSNG